MLDPPPHPFSEPLGSVPDRSDRGAEPSPLAEQAIALARLATVYLNGIQARRGLDELDRLEQAGVRQFSVVFAPNHTIRPLSGPAPSGRGAVALPVFGGASLDGELEGHRIVSPPPTVWAASEVRTVDIRLISRDPSVATASIAVDIGAEPLTANEVRLLLRAKINQADSPVVARTLENRFLDPLIAELARGRVRPDEVEEHRLHLTEVLWRTLRQFADPDLAPPACDIRSAALLAGRRESQRFLHRRRYGSVPVGVAVAHIVARLSQRPNPVARPDSLTPEEWRSDYMTATDGRSDVPALEHWRRALAVVSGAGSARPLSTDAVEAGHDGRPQTLGDRLPDRSHRQLPGVEQAKREGRVLRLLREIRRGRPLSARLRGQVEVADPIQARRWPPHHRFMATEAWVAAERSAIVELLTTGLDDALISLRVASHRAYSLRAAGADGERRASSLLRRAAGIEMSP